MAGSSHLGQSFHPRQKKGLGKGKNKFLTRTFVLKENYCPVTVIMKVKIMLLNLQYFSEIINLKQK